MRRPELKLGPWGATLWLLPPLFALLPHLQYLPLWLGGACLGAWAWRLALAMQDKPLPPRLLRGLLALAGLAAVFWEYKSIVGQQAGVPFFILLLFVKLLESSALAEKRLLLILTQFAAMSYFLTDQSILVTAYLLVVSVMSIAVMAHLQSNGVLLPALALRRTFLLFAGGVPLALMLFVFFPRLDRPLWSLPTEAQGGSTGLSEDMTPGDIASLIQSGETAFRARFSGTRPDPNGLYWRGIVLREFDGRTWHVGTPDRPFLGLLETRGEPWTLDLTLEPHQRRWLFTPGVPDPLPQETALTESFQWQARDRVIQRKRWSVRVFPDYRHLDPPGDLARDLALPEGFNPRAIALARSWRDEDPRPQALVRKAMDMYAASFIYTLQPPLLGLHSVDDFLFGSKRGFCEHYAGSFVFLMRAAGVPARVVTGYLGGEINPLDGHIVVRQSDAHAWAEVWMGQELGWVRADPTASISPARVERGIGAALPAAELPPALARLSLPVLQGIRHAWEMLNNRWDQWVLGYGQDQQLQLLARLSPALASVRWLASAAILAGLLGLALLAWFFWHESRKGPRDRAAQAWHGLERRLAAIGLAPLAGEGPRHYMLRVGSARPDLAGEVETITRLYLAARYDGRVENLEELVGRVARFKPGRPHDPLVTS